MTILCSELYEKQLKDILAQGLQENVEETKKFKMYLDTVIINLPTKVQKYKKSRYFDDENIKDIEFQGFVIPFYIDKEKQRYVLLGITN
ncbi:hypothetical protein MNB_SM-3-1267 [hydrothermal vent metagenome]|uniref:Uncharacterized protein n=1 Tax=hydrothermal vent metagenome TaxID=652676 RepID=A0A1W1D3N5_9ZZZZ